MSAEKLDFYWPFTDTAIAVEDGEIKGELKVKVAIGINVSTFKFDREKSHLLYLYLKERFE